MKHPAEVVEKKGKRTQSSYICHFLPSLRLPWTRIGTRINDDLPQRSSVQRLLSYRTPVHGTLNIQMILFPVTTISQ